MKHFIKYYAVSNRVFPLLGVLFFCAVFFFPFEASAQRKPVGDEFFGVWEFSYANAKTKGTVTKITSVEEFYSNYDFKQIPVFIHFLGNFQARIINDLYKEGKDVIASKLLSDMNFDFRIEEDSKKKVEEQIEIDLLLILSPVYTYIHKIDNSTIELQCPYNYYDNSSQSYMDGVVNIFYKKR